MNGEITWGVDNIIKLEGAAKEQLERLARSSKIFPGGILLCPKGRAFAKNFCSAAGLLTTSKKFPGVCLGEGGGKKFGAWN